MTRYFCDRCKAEVANKFVLESITVVTDDPGARNLQQDRIRMDLCHACAKAFMLCVLVDFQERKIPLEP